MPARGPRQETCSLTDAGNLAQAVSDAQLAGLQDPSIIAVAGLVSR
jgi:hypothetical protein